MTFIIGLIIWLIVAVIVLWLVNMIVSALPNVPGQLRNLILALVAVLLLIAFLGRYGSYVGLH